MGVGWEYGFAPNWSAGIEYDHLFMGHQYIYGHRREPEFACSFYCISQDVDMVTVRMDYHFGLGG